MSLSLDLRSAFRGLRRSRLLSLSALATLAIGIGLAAALFGVVDAFLLQPLPFQAPDRLVVLRERNPRLRSESSPVAADNFLAWKRTSRSFSALAAYSIADLELILEDGRAERISGARASAELFPLLGVAPAQGRTFVPEEDSPTAAAPVAVIGERLWARLGGGGSLAAGRSLQVEGQRLTVIGVMPAGFAFPRGVEVWLPLGPELTEKLKQRGSRSLSVVARLAPGVSLSAARREMEGLSARLAESSPDINKGYAASVVPLREHLSGRLRPLLLGLIGAVAVVLLAVVTNVSGLLLAQADGRRQEAAVRVALGAPRWRLARQMLTESLLLALPGGAAGLLLARGSLPGIGLLIPPDLRRQAGISIDLRVILFGAGLALITGLLAGAFPAFQATRPDLRALLNEGTAALGRGVAGRRFRRALVIAQVALAVVLTVGSGLAVRSFRRLAEVSPGFDPAGVLTLQVTLPASLDDGRGRAFALERLLEAVRAVPGVTACAVASRAPLSGPAPPFELEVVDRPPPPPGQVPWAVYEQVSPEYFRILRIPLLRGRSLAEGDVFGRNRAAVVNQTFARRLFPGEDPVGRFLGMKFGIWVYYEIVGVVGDVRQSDLREEPQPAVYVAFAQNPTSFFTLFVRGGSDPLRLAPDLRAALGRLETAVVVTQVAPLEARLADVLDHQRLASLLLGAFAAVATLLALIGVYGLAHDSVLRQRREIGLRMALGARPGQVVGLVVRQIAVLVLAGVGGGLAAALLLRRLLAGLLYGVAASDALVVVGAPALLAGVAIAAAWLPARRAARVDPLLALRPEAP